MEKLENALTATSSWLVAFVPKALLVYGERRIQDRLDTLRKSLPEAGPDREPSILKEIMKLKSAQMKVRQQLGREKKF